MDFIKQCLILCQCFRFVSQDTRTFQFGFEWFYRVFPTLNVLTFHDWGPHIHCVHRRLFARLCSLVDIWNQDIFTARTINAGTFLIFGNSISVSGFGWTTKHVSLGAHSEQNCFRNHKTLQTSLFWNFYNDWKVQNCDPIQISKQFWKNR